MSTSAMTARDMQSQNSAAFGDPILAAVGCIIGLSIVTTLPALLVDQRQFQGASIWLKPLKFQIALAIYLLTLAFYARWLPEAMRVSRRYRIFSGAVAACAVAELLWVAGAAMLGTTSHYNRSTPSMAALYAFMGVLALILTSGSLVLGITILRNLTTPLEPHMRLAVGLGLILTFVLTIAATAFLSAGAGHGVGVPPGAARIPVLTWAREGGDLRVAHLFATHTLHVIPLAGLAIGRTTVGEHAKRWVIIAAIAYSSLVLLTLTQALMGRPLLS